MRTRVLPYLTPADESIDHGGWHLRSPDGESQLDTEVPHWDYQAVLRLMAPISVDRRAVLDRCELGPSTRLQVQVLVHSSATRARGAGVIVDVVSSDRHDLAVELELPGRLLGGQLTLETLLVAAQPDPRSAAAPHRPGSILWRHKQKTHLEGEGAQFPTDAYSFGKVMPNTAKALWSLRIDETDPGASFMSSVRLALNTDAAAIREVVAGAQTPEAARVVKFIRSDVLRQLVFVGMRSDWLDDSELEPDDLSLGAVVTRMIRQVFPNETPTAVQKQMEQDPNMIERMVQDHAQLAD